jgi:hypothetical protein
MRDHLVDDDLDAEPVGRRHHFVEIGKRAENRIDITIVRNIVAHIGHRRLEEWRQPDGIDTEAGNIGQSPANALQVA